MGQLVGTAVGMIVFGFLWYYINVTKKEGNPRLLETFLVTVLFGIMFQFFIRLFQF